MKVLAIGYDDLVKSSQSTELIIKWAHEVGFDAAGIAGVQRSSNGETFTRWLDADYHAGMEYLRHRMDARLDPSLVLDGATSVLCVAMRYAPHESPASEDDDLWPWVAKYAHGKDYHDLMVRKLKLLADRIRDQFPEAAVRWYVDTGPVLERELAARAGLGVVGKNSCLLNREMGSWFLLGELFLTLDLSACEPLSDLCGRCTLCLDACPTDALREPYLLDANRCISFWTIEHREPLPPEARDMTGEWVFGCDICQDVCPWNRRQLPPIRDENLQLSPERRELDLTGLLRIGREEYVEAFRGSPMKRSKQQGLQRNAAVAMGNRGDKRYVSPLGEALESDPHPMVRGHSAWALGKIGNSEALGILDRALSNEEDESVCVEIRKARRSTTPTSPT